MTFSLVRCAADGEPVEPIGVLAAGIAANCVSTANLYARVGFVEPWEGRGYATQTAAGLLAIARRAQPGVVITAFTLPEWNGSAKVLQRLGFELFGNARDPDAGDVWEWRA